MAHAEKLTKKVLKTVAVDVETVELTLTKDEAETLGIITKFICGCPVGSRRAHTGAIGAALADAGIDCWKFRDDLTGSLEFRDTEMPE